MMTLFWPKVFYKKHPLRWLLLPAALVYQAISYVRRQFLVRFRQQFVQVPVIVVGNISVGGTGKTPLVIALAHKLRSKGLKVGIISRGYRASVKKFPHEVSLYDTAEKVGDEPLLLAKKTGCPVVIAPKRIQAAQYLLDKYQSQVILSDDGLQHYALGRTLEIAVVDGARGLGNGLCLPAGPLRESRARLHTVDWVVVNGGKWPKAYSMHLTPGPLTHLASGQIVSSKALEPPLAAVAAIGNPQRFFNTLAALNISFTPYIFADHHLFKPQELVFREKSIVMTEKDAVKCQLFATPCMYFLPVEAQVEEAFWEAFWLKLEGFLQ